MHLFKTAIAIDIMPSDRTSGRITLHDNFCNLLTSSQINKSTMGITVGQWAIRAAKNKGAYDLNETNQINIESEAVTYETIYIIFKADKVLKYPTGFFLGNRIIPPHLLKLKTGVQILMLCNISQTKLCRNYWGI